MIGIILIILAIYLILYFKPYIDKTVKNEWILWYNHREEITIGKFKISRRFIYLNKYKL